MRMIPVFQRVGTGYVAWMDGLPGALTQGATLGEARRNLAQAARLWLETDRMIGALRQSGAWPPSPAPKLEPRASLLDLDLPSLPGPLALGMEPVIVLP